MRSSPRALPRITTFGQAGKSTQKQVVWQAAQGIGRRVVKARRLIESSLFAPQTLHVLFQAFDQAWAEIAGNFGDDAQEIERGRMQLAHAVLAVAQEDGGDAEGLKDAALAVMALSYGKSS